MAEFDSKQGSFLQYQLALKLKTQLMNLSTLTSRQVKSLLFELRNESNNAEYTRLIRRYLPIIMQRSGEQSSLITSSYFEQAREINSLTAGSAIGLATTLSVNPEAYLSKRDDISILIDKKMGAVTWNFNKLWSPELVYDLNPIKDLGDLSTNSVNNFIEIPKILNSSMNQQRKDKIINMLNSDGTIKGFVAGKREIINRNMLEAPISEAIARAPLDYSFLQIESLVDQDPKAKRKIQRITRGLASCVFCKHMATFVGSEGWAKDKFHDHCKCTPAASFAYSETFQPDWSKQYEEEYYEIEKKLQEESKNFEKRKIQTTRYSESKGKQVTSMKVVWIDKRTGKESTPPKTGRKAILSELNKRQKKD